VVIPHLYNGRDKTFFFYSRSSAGRELYDQHVVCAHGRPERIGDFSTRHQPVTGKPGPVAVCGVFNPEPARARPTPPRIRHQQSRDFGGFGGLYHDIYNNVHLLTPGPGRIPIR